jgi:hypothetical protein
MSDTTFHPATQGFAEPIARSTGTPILRRPEEYGMATDETIYHRQENSPCSEVLPSAGG